VCVCYRCVSIIKKSPRSVMIPHRCSPKQLKMYEALMEHHKTICDAARDGEVCVCVCVCV
jgi:hypothetical protein